MNSEARIQELEAKVNELTALVERMAPALRGATTPDDTTADRHAPLSKLAETPTSSRRGDVEARRRGEPPVRPLWPWPVTPHQLPPPTASAPHRHQQRQRHRRHDPDRQDVGARRYPMCTADILTGIAGTIIGWDVSNSTSANRVPAWSATRARSSVRGNTPHGVMGIVAANTGDGLGRLRSSNSDVRRCQRRLCGALRQGEPSRRQMVVGLQRRSPQRHVDSRRAAARHGGEPLVLRRRRHAGYVAQGVRGRRRRARSIALSPGRVYDSRRHCRSRERSSAATTAPSRWPTSATRPQAPSPPPTSFPWVPPPSPRTSRSSASAGPDSSR